MGARRGHAGRPPRELPALRLAAIFSRPSGISRKISGSARRFYGSATFAALFVF
jgi:hypothetical protein